MTTAPFSTFVRPDYSISLPTYPNTLPHFLADQSPANACFSEHSSTSPPPPVLPLEADHAEIPSMGHLGHLPPRPYAQPPGVLTDDDDLADVEINDHSPSNLGDVPKPKPPQSEVANDGKPGGQAPKIQGTSAQRRATHNAIERARRESLNGRFLQLARALPTMANVKRPSKSVIVNKSLEWICEAQVREFQLLRENALLRIQLEEMRLQLQMEPLVPGPRAHHLGNEHCFSAASAVTGLRDEPPRSPPGSSSSPAFGVAPPQPRLVPSATAEQVHSTTPNHHRSAPPGSNGAPFLANTATEYCSGGSEGNNNNVGNAFDPRAAGPFPPPGNSQTIHCGSYATASQYGSSVPLAGLTEPLPECATGADRGPSSLVQNSAFDPHTALGSPQYFGDGLGGGDGGRSPGRSPSSPVNRIPSSASSDGSEASTSQIPQDIFQLDNNFPVLDSRQLALGASGSSSPRLESPSSQYASQYRNHPVLGSCHSARVNPAMTAIKLEDQDNSCVVTVGGEGGGRVPAVSGSGIDPISSLAIKAADPAAVMVAMVNHQVNQSGGVISSNGHLAGLPKTGYLPPVDGSPWVW